MKKALVFVLAIAITVGAVSATKGPKAAQSLSKQVKALQAQVSKLQKRVGDLEGYNACDFVRAIRTWGDTNDSPKFGYSYSEKDGTAIFTTALDYVNPDNFNKDTDNWFTLVDPSCITANNGRVQIAHASQR
jgi:hypothetical protein